jgi:hypothetical protein
MVKLNSIHRTRMLSELMRSDILQSVKIIDTKNCHKWLAGLPILSIYSANFLNFPLTFILA